MTRASRVKREPFVAVTIDDDDCPSPSPARKPRRASGPASKVASVAPRLTEPAHDSIDAMEADDGDVDMDDSSHVVTNGANHVVTNGDTSNTQNGLHDRSPASDAMQTLGKQSRQLIQVIQRLETLCIDATLPSLPKFVVVGDQSAGKSSIIEAICGITLPRGPGTCTRCPFQITTTASRDSSSAEWCCKVSLHRRYAYSPSAKAGRDPTKYDRWSEQQLEKTEFATVYDRDMLETVLRNAQAATLSPGRHPMDFANSPTVIPATTQVGFSPNVVSLVIEGADLPELSFFDLPGTINVHEDENKQHLVSFIERLVKNYLLDANALILLACSGDQDVENSTAFKHTSDCKALSRCMGVLTKPDLITGTTRFPLIRRILKKEAFTLGNGWFVTKQLSQEDLDSAFRITHYQAREREREFFASKPWSMEFPEFAGRFGISNLQDAISQKLTSHILKALPEIITRVETRLAEVSRQLAEFPEKPNSASHAVIDDAHLVVAEINARIRGDCSDSNFRPDYRALVRDLRENLREARPQVKLGTPGYIPPVFDVEDDDGEEPAPASTPVQTPSKMRKLNNGNADRTPQGRAPTETPRLARSNHEGLADRTKAHKATFDLDEIKLAFDRGSNTGIPGQSDPKVTDFLVKTSIGGWRNLIKSFLSEVTNLLAEMLHKGISTALATRTQTLLFQKISDLAETLADDLLKEQNKVIMHIVDCEQHKPVTYNKIQTRTLTAEAKARLAKERLAQRVDEFFDTLGAGPEGPKVPPPRERKNKLEEYGARLGPDDYAREVEAMATTWAYYDIASARLLDTVASHLEFGLLHAMETGLREVILRGLDVTNEHHCMQLIAEDPEREALRIGLLEEKKKLDDALEELRALPQRNGA